MDRKSVLIGIIWLVLHLGLQKIVCQDVGIVHLPPESEMIELKPFLTFHFPESDHEDPDSIKDETFERLNAGLPAMASEKVWVKFRLGEMEVKKAFVLLSRLGNYANKFTLFYQVTPGLWTRKSYSYETPINQREFPVGEAALKIPAGLSSQDIYILMEINHWMTSDWALYTQEGFARHQRILTIQINVYIVVFMLFACFGMAASVLLRNRLTGIFALYALSMGIYILLEANWLSEYIFYGNPAITLQSSQFIFGLLVLATLMYARETIREGNLPKILGLAYKVFIVISIGYMLVGHLSLGHQLLNTTSVILAYGTTIIIIVSAILNIRSNPTMRWLIGGLVIMALAGILIDLHARNVIYMPSSIYLTIPALILELICVGIGTLLAARLALSKLKLANSQNEHLQNNVNRLKSEINHTLSAYETFVNRSNRGELNVPSKYYDNPLSAREFQILQLLSNGHNNRQIAHELYLSRNTIKTHLKESIKNWAQTVVKKQSKKPGSTV